MQDDYDDADDLASLRKHKLTFDKDRKDANTRNHDDDYMVRCRLGWCMRVIGHVVYCPTIKR